MANTAASVLAIARGELGKTDGTKYGRWYANRVGNSYFAKRGVAWCAMFVSWCFAQAGAKCAGLPAASCTYGIYAGAKGKGVIVSAKNAKPGDVVLFNFDGNASDSEHVGIVELNKGTYLQTIEGNTGYSSQANGGQVMRKTRAYKYVFAVIRPYYDKAPAPTPVIEKLAVDGIAGPKTIKRWQQVMGSRYVDGVISGQYKPNQKYFPAITSVTFEDTGESELVRLCQKAMKIYVDGYMGKDFARALCARLGCKNKTVIDKDVVMALQKTLNMGKF